MKGFLFRDGKFVIDQDRMRTGDATDGCCCETAGPGGCTRCGQIGLAGKYYNGAEFGALAATRLDGPIDFTWDGSPAPGVDAEDFSVKWSGEVIVKGNGAVTFYVTSQHGVRLYTDSGFLRIDQWDPPHATTEHTWTTITTNYVPGSKIKIVLDFKSTTGTAIIKLEWSQANLPREVIPLDSMWSGQSNAMTTGLFREAFTTIDLSGPPTTTTVSQINFSSPGPNSANSNRYTGFLQWPKQVASISPSTTAATLDLTHTDGARLWINDELVIDNWIDQPSITNTVVRTLRGGRYYPFRLEHYDNGGANELKLQWTYAGQTKTLVPSTYFAQGERYPSPGQYTVTIEGVTLCLGCFEDGAGGGQSITGGSINGTFCLTASFEDRCTFIYQESPPAGISFEAYSASNCSGSPLTEQKALGLQLNREVGYSTFQINMRHARLFSSGAIVGMDCNVGRTTVNTTGSASCLSTSKNRGYGGTATFTPGSC